MPRVLVALLAGLPAIALNTGALAAADLVPLGTAHGGLLHLLVMLTGSAVPSGRPSQTWGACRALTEAADRAERREGGLSRLATTYRLCSPPRFETVSCVPRGQLVSSGRVVLRHVIVQARRRQHHLLASLTLHKTLRADIPNQSVGSLSCQSVFTRPRWYLNIRMIDIESFGPVVLQSTRARESDRATAAGRPHPGSNGRR